MEKESRCNGNKLIEKENAGEWFETFLNVSCSSFKKYIFLIAIKNLNY